MSFWNRKALRLSKIKLWQLLVLLSIISMLLLAGGYLYYSSEAKSIRTIKSQEIQAIAALKINQIIQWRKERFDDAFMATRGPFLKKEVEQFLADKQNTA